MALVKRFEDLILWYDDVEEALDMLDELKMDASFNDVRYYKDYKTTLKKWVYVIHAKYR